MHFYIDNVTFAPPSAPILLQILSGAQLAQDLLPKGSVIPLPRNSVIEISMPGGAPGGDHPFHLHGVSPILFVYQVFMSDMIQHTFAVVRGANSSTYNYVDPIYRDTVNTGFFGDNVTIRFEVS